VRSAFEALDQIFYIVVTEPFGEAHWSGRYDELAARLLPGRHQALTKKMVDGFFQGRAGTPHFFVQQIGDVIAD
jgi:hypothetical protein